MKFSLFFFLLAEISFFPELCNYAYPQRKESSILNEKKCNPSLNISILINLTSTVHYPESCITLKKKHFLSFSYFDQVKNKSVTQLTWYFSVELSNLNTNGNASSSEAVTTQLMVIKGKKMGLKVEIWSILLFFSDLLYRKPLLKN